ncbi:MAG: class I SAM-dependent methyltransferase [Parachlamydiaceae bacterium]|nr:class I SAM-dependent methyltransferase [Parachlamydiaceae bacterium]
MSRSNFLLFRSHLDLAHQYWSKLNLKGSIVIDATCGNGHDTLLLCQQTLQENETGLVYAFDNQIEAIQSTDQLLKKNLTPQQLSKVFLEKRCHSTFPECIAKESVELIVYNLGYLPGGNKLKTTLSLTSLESLTSALPLIKHGGLISVTCYPGHPEGKEERLALLNYVNELSPCEWSCSHHQWINRNQSPSLLLLQRKLSDA